MKKIWKTTLIVSFVALALIIGPLIFALLFNLPAISSKIPFNSEIWFNFWPGYLSLVATILLSGFTITLTVGIFRKETANNRLGTIMPSKLEIEKLTQTDDDKVFISKVKFIEEQLLLSYNQVIKIQEMNFYLCTAEKDVFYSDDLFLEEFTVIEKYKDDLLKIPIVGNTATSGDILDNNTNLILTPIFLSGKIILNAKLKLDENVVGNNIFDTAYRIWLNDAPLAQDSKQLIVEFSYLIEDNNPIFQNKLLKKLFNKHSEMLQYNRINYELKNYPYDGKNSGIYNSEIYKYEAVSNYRNIIHID